uniref:Mannose-1-phosphate guanyltransferase alpha n=1 Tax=Aceria tosichella TaxID=561515 RepID=A0A6G1S302_9ACAR
MTIKAIILIGGPNKGQRFRPLSFDSPKHMFPVGGQTIIGHLIESCLRLKEVGEIILLGFHQQDETLSQSYLQNLVERYTGNRQDRGHVPTIKYLQEFTRMGTAGGLYHFRDQLRHNDPTELVVINGDVCGDFDFDSMLAQHRERIEWAKRTNHPKPYITVMTTEADRQESLNYGCIVENQENHVIEHYVEKPSTFVSNVINCGAYICSLDLLDLLEDTMRKKRQESTANSNIVLNDRPIYTHRPDPDHDYLTLELDILQQRFNLPHCFAYRTQGAWWCQVKTAASAIYANKKYLEHNRESAGDGNHHSATERRSNSGECEIIGHVYIHPTAKVDASSVIGPNVSIMENCIIGPGVRIKDSIILKNALVHPHSLILCSIVGWDCSIGAWARVEGTPGEPDPNQRFAKVQNPPLFNPVGKLNPYIRVG